MRNKELNIYERLLEITNEISPLLKDMEVGKGYNSYKAISEAKVKDVVKPLEYKYGVYSYPMDSKELQTEVLETEKTYKETTETKLKFILRIKVLYRFVNVDKPDEFIDVVSYGDGVDALDKSPGKALTYSFKTALINAYKIISGDDPDQFHSNDNEITRNKQTTKQYSTHGGKTETQAKNDSTKKALQTVMRRLENDENKEYKAQVMKKVCEAYGVDKWFDITFDKKPYTEFIELVKKYVDEAKQIKEAGL